jgi:hypothetical protein
MSSTSRYVALLALIASFVVLHLAYNAHIPLGEGPDEPGHVAYALFLANEHRLPVVRETPATSDVPGEGHQPPLAYLLMLPAFSRLSESERQIVLTTNPDWIWAGGNDHAAHMRGSREYWPWQGMTLAWHLARSISGLWGILTILFTYFAMRRLLPNDDKPALLAAALVAYNPQFLFTTALVTNDALATSLGAAALWLSIRAASDRDRWSLTWAGLVFGLALITKQSTLMLGPLIAWAGWQAASGNTRRLIARNLAWSLPVVLIAGWWYLRNYQLYGDIFGLAVFTERYAGQSFEWGRLQAWRSALSQLFESSWARFGWMTLRPPDWILWIYAGLVGLAVTGWLIRRPSGELRRLWIAPILMIGVALLWAFSFALTAGLVAWQGRLLFPAIGAASILLAGGLIQLGAVRIPILSLLAVCLLALAAVMPLTVIGPAYHWQALPPAQAQAELGEPAYVRYAARRERGLELHGWQLAAEARPGTTLPIDLTWHSLDPISRDWTVFVHLTNGDGVIVAESNSKPLQGSVPFPRWTPGDWMRDRHLLELPPDLPPGIYQLRVGLYLPDEDGQRQQAWDTDRKPLDDAPLIGEVQVIPY